jgi:uncharacterized protein (TIGR02246 family)
MKNLSLRAAVACVLLSSAHSQIEDPNKQNLEALEKNAVAFVEAYNKADAESLSNLFLPEGEIVLANGEVVAGREEISNFYQEVFAPEAKPKAALEAGSVRFVTPGIAIEDGTLHVTKPSGEVISHYYTAIQVKQENGAWLTASIRDEVEDHAPASEKLIPLEWLIGDWLIEKEGTRTFLSFSWSEDGPFIDGKAVTEQAGEDSTSSTWRIGWNSNRKNYVSWAFDALGGYTKSDWSASEDGWLMRTTGVTADGEINQSTQSIVPDDKLQGFTWSSRDQTIGGEIAPDRTVRVVKRPPLPAGEDEATEEEAADKE